MGNKKTPRIYDLHKHGYFLKTKMTDSDLPDLPENSRTVRRLKKKEQRKNKRR
tara:strand:+ start:512 stop:670 length:159 start_codon:yes stop_codon:yes gene_type:complete